MDVNIKIFQGEKVYYPLTIKMAKKVLLFHDYLTFYDIEKRKGEEIYSIVILSNYSFEYLFKFLTKEHLLATNFFIFSDILPSNLLIDQLIVESFFHCRPYFLSIMKELNRLLFYDRRMWIKKLDQLPIDIATEVYLHLCPCFLPKNLSDDELFIRSYHNNFMQNDDIAPIMKNQNIRTIITKNILISFIRIRDELYLMEGLYHSWYNSGKKKRKCYYRKGQVDGKMEKWTDN